MSSLIFTNKSSITMLVTAENQTYKLMPGHVQRIVIQQNNANFTVCPDSINSIRHFLKGAGLISKRHFVVCSAYTLESAEECEITLYSEIKKGKFMDEYEFCVTQCMDGVLSQPTFSVKDGDSFRQELLSNTNKSQRAMILFDVLDILSNALIGALLLVIPFLLIWIFGNIQLAWDICSVAFIPIFIIIVLINRLFDKLKKLAWKKGKSYALKNQIFKDSSSYFEHEYIMSVYNGKK